MLFTSARMLPVRRGQSSCEGLPHYLDAQRLTIEQREELIEDLIALKDVVEEEEVCFAPEEDFA